MISPANHSSKEIHWWYTYTTLKQDQESHLFSASELHIWQIMKYDLHHYSTLLFYYYF